MLGSSSVPATLNPHFRPLPTNSHLKISKLVASEAPGRRIRATPKQQIPLSTHHHLLLHQHRSVRTVVTRVNSNDDSTNVEEASKSSSSSTLGDGYVSLFIRMLGLDNDPLDRDQGIVALWKYSLGGKKNIDNIMRFPGCLNLAANLLRSESNSTCEAAAGLLRSISVVNLYRDSVAQSGAIEEITALLNRPSLPPEVKEQSLCTLWNLSVDGKIRERMGSVDILSILVKCLDKEEDIKVKEASGGILANLALSVVNHKSMVEEGVIPKLAKFLKNNDEGSKVLRKETRNALLELSRDEYYKILVTEEGLVHVPLVGPAAYKTYAPSRHSWPSLPDGTEIELSEEEESRRKKKPSRFGASELLLGLNNVDDDEKSSKIIIDEGKRNAVLGRSRQQFLVRIDAVEIEEAGNSESKKKVTTTLLPWIDGVARLVLLLELEDEAAVSRSAEAIADASIGEDMRIAFRDAGAAKHLVRLLGYKNRSFEFQVVRALERLSVSNSVCQVIEAEGVIDPLFDILRCKDCSEDLLNKTLDILGRIFDTGKETRSKFNDGSDTRKVTDLAENRITKTDPRHSIMDLSVVDRLVEILKTSNSNLQKKAASILEFVAVTDPTANLFASVDIEAGLDAVFKQRVLEEPDSELEGKEPEKYALQIEEAGLAISAASRLLTKLLGSEPFLRRVDLDRFTDPLRNTLKSEIPLRSKKWVAECLISIDESLPGPHKGPSIRSEVTIHETVPRLIDRIGAGPTREAREEAVVVLRWLMSEGLVTDPVRARGCVGPVVGLMAEEGVSDRAVEAGVAILHSVSAAESEIRGEIVAVGAIPILKRIVLAKRPHWNEALLLLKTLPI